ncbi:MAG TPA: bifunctional sulfate adenylyltransferase/adenylylsulfate kinase [Verrucomicrobiales bacterium]|nr:bifunctional sulfate adenylyltransferase/adenylylsulfate kinase [Verrucomicrobiales bacterium]
MEDHLISPHGGTLRQLLAGAARAAALKDESRGWPSWDLTPRQMCDLELLLSGAFSPLPGFLREDEYTTVCEGMRLPQGQLWPIPVVLDVTDAVAETLSEGDSLALRDPEGVMLAALHIENIWRPDRLIEAESVYGSANLEHKGVEHLLRRTHPVYLGGRVEGLQLPIHYDSRTLRETPSAVRAAFHQLGWRKVIAFQTRNPMHRAHFELTMRAIREHQANLLIHPVVGMTKSGDVDHYTRVRCYQALLPHYPQHTVRLSLLPLSMRMAGPREALWHALIRRNYGCSHLIVGRDHAGPGQDRNGVDFYPPYAAQELAQEYAAETGVEVIPFQHLVYSEDRDRYLQTSEARPGERTLSLSGTELRRRLADGREIPEWFTFREVSDELRRTHPPRTRQGFTVFFTGLSGSGKSTIARILQVKLLETGDRPVTLLDGDIVRKNLSSELGFSRDHRNLNILRIGFVANEISKNGGIAICAPIAPYDEIRKEVRHLVESNGGFILVHIATPVEICEQRDRKGLYAKARAGILKEFTGISDPYEEPLDADVHIDTTRRTPEEACQQILLHLESEGYIGARA